MSSKKKWLLIAYIPVLHQGYLEMFATLKKKYSCSGKIALIDKSLFPNQRSLVKDLRAVDSKIMEQQLLSLQKNLDLKLDVTVINQENLDQFTNFVRQLLKLKVNTQKKEKNKQKFKIDKHNDEKTEINITKVVMTNDLLNENLLNEHFSDLKKSANLELLDIFLRWDYKKSLSKADVHPAQKITREKFDQKMIELAFKEAQKSLDWWRQVGAVLVIPSKNKNSKHPEIAIVARNNHLPFDQQPYVLGDPRADYSKGQFYEVSTAIHAEALIIATASKKGISTKGAWMYVTTFPCPVCAKLISKSGITKLFYSEGYSLIQAQEILENAEVEIAQVV
jgi:deoxycytidylate deaminase